jgi:Spy/CpxP family protein refolding chaperone
MGAINPMLLRQLDLSDAQRDRVKEITDSHRDEQRAFGGKARAAHEALEAAIVAGPLDESTIRGKAPTSQRWRPTWPLSAAGSTARSSRF